MPRSVPSSPGLVPSTWCAQKCTMVSLRTKDLVAWQQRRAIPCLPKRKLQVPAEAGRRSEEYDSAALSLCFSCRSVVFRPSPGVPPSLRYILAGHPTTLPPCHPPIHPSCRAAVRLASLVAFPRRIPRGAEMAGIREWESAALLLFRSPPPTVRSVRTVTAVRAVCSLFSVQRRGRARSRPPRPSHLDCSHRATSSRTLF